MTGLSFRRRAKSSPTKELDSKLKLHATTRSFPVEQITETIEERLNDEDVKQNPIFRELLEEYRETRPKEMRDRGYPTGALLHWRRGDPARSLR